MKSFSEHIIEALRGDDGVRNAIDDVSKAFGGPHNLNNPEVLERINAIIGKYVEEEYINPLAVVRIVREHLSHLGVGFSSEPFQTFDVRKENTFGPIGETRDVTIPLYRWGGRYGRLSDESAEITSDDGLTNDGKSLSINFSFLKLENNKFNVAVKII